MEAGARSKRYLLKGVNEHKQTDTEANENEQAVPGRAEKLGSYGRPKQRVGGMDTRWQEDMPCVHEEVSHND